MVLASGFIGLDRQTPGRFSSGTGRITPAPIPPRPKPSWRELFGCSGRDAWYFGKLYKKPTIGDDLRPVEYEDIKRANQLLYATALLSLLVFSLVKFLVLWA